MIKIKQIKIFLLLFISSFLLSCGNNPPRQSHLYSPNTPLAGQPASQGVTYRGLMTVTNKKEFSRFLENARTGCGTRWSYGSFDCDNWTANPVLTLTFSQDLKTVTSIQFLLGGSGGWFTGNKGQRTPLFLRGGPVRPINESQGWEVSVNVNNTTRFILYCEFCDLREGDFEDLKVYRGSKDNEMGVFSFISNAQDRFTIW